MAFSILDVPPLSFSFDGTDEKAILVLGPVSIGNNQIGTFSNFLQFECRGLSDRIPCKKADWHSNGLDERNSDVGFPIYQGVDDSILAWFEGVRHDECALSKVFRLCRMPQGWHSEADQRARLTP